MTAAEAILDLHEKKRPAPNWTSTKGVYADLSGYPDVEYYVKCPKCGQVHGSYKTMREAHAKRLCGVCDLDAIEKLKKEVAKVDEPKNRHKPGKSTSKMFNEADELVPPPPPEDEFDPREYVLTAPPPDNWIEQAMWMLGQQQETHFSLSHRNQDALDDPDEVAKVEVEGENGTEWTIHRSEEEARDEALLRVRNDLETQPEVFNKDWLQGHVNMERLKNYFRETARDLEWLEDMDEQKQVDYLCNLRNPLLDSEDFYTPNGRFRKITKRTQRLFDQAKEALADRQEEEFDPIDYLEGIYGKDEAMGEAIKLVGIDVDAAAEEAVQTDGWVHFMGSYDGNYTELENGAVAYRTN